MLTALLLNSNHVFLKSPAEVDIVTRIRKARNGVSHLDKCSVSQDTYDAGIVLIESFCSDESWPVSRQPSTGSGKQRARQT